MLLYGRGTRSQKLQFVWRDRTGKLLRTFDPPVESVRTFALSPDESRVAYQAVGSPGDVWVLDLQRGVTNRITLKGGDNPQGSPDGSGAPELLWKTPGGDARPDSVSPDNQHLLFNEGGFSSFR
ncbi:MAG: hypothetical protein NTV52_37010 [Acidobacteria bacterium]|nr:hypothetical protein [Acidobacteriota bacterium]